MVHLAQLFLAVQCPRASHVHKRHVKFFVQISRKIHTIKAGKTIYFLLYVLIIFTNNYNTKISVFVT